MPSVHLAQWTWHDRSGLAKDRRINTFYFHGPIGPGTDYDNVRDLLFDFYFEEYSAGQSVARYLSPLLGPATAEKSWSLRLYDMDQAKPRIPVYEDEAVTSMGAPSQPPLPSEVALVVSFQAERVPGIPQARRRNRIYLGPLSMLGADASPSTPSRPVAALTLACKNAGAALINAAQASNNWNFIAYSPTYQQGAPVVTDGWVDNAWDTQRRRGREPTERNPFGAGAP